MQPLLRACIRAHGGHLNTIGLDLIYVRFDVCTDVHFDSHRSARLPVVDTVVLGDLTKPAITIASVERFYLNLVICLR